MPAIIAPRQTACISCRGKVKDKFSGKEEIKDNIITIDWHMQTSFEPFLYAISIGKTRFSCSLINKSRVFVVNFTPFSYKDEVLFCGRHSGEHMDKFRESGLRKEEAEKIDCCRIKEAVAFLECEVINQIEAGDHIIFIGKVVNSEERGKEKRVFHTTGDSFTTTVD